MARISPNHAASGNLWAAAWLAQLAYESDAAKVASIAASWGIVPTAMLAPVAGVQPWQAQTFGIMFEGRDQTVLTFAGTDPLRFANWLSDLRFVTGPDDIHNGFAGALDAAWSDVETGLRRVAPSRPLWIVGHSLGAALAVVCAKRVHDVLGVMPEAVYAFGLPRVGGARFAADYEAVLGPRTIRLVHGSDLVATIPPTRLGFRHVGRRLSCASLSRFDCSLLSRTPDDDPGFPDDLAPAVTAVLQVLQAGPFSQPVRADPVGLASALLPPAVADHLPDRYCRAAQDASEEGQETTRPHERSA